MPVISTGGGAFAAVAERPLYWLLLLPVLYLSCPEGICVFSGRPWQYYDRMQEGTNIILLAPDLMDTFPDSDSVNEALRSLKAIATRTAHRA